MDIKSDYKSVLFSGCSIDYRDITLCNLANFIPIRAKMASIYQVHSRKMKFSKIYKNIDDAVDMFIQLKRQAK